MNMELKQASGNTWYLADWQLIPLYRLDRRRSILLDAGDLSQRKAIETTLEREGITPVGILGTHAHPDHASNFAYFQRRYHLPVAMSFGEAGICTSALSLKAYFFMLSPGQIRRLRPDISEMVIASDCLIRPEQREFRFCDVTFDILHTPGHSPDHIAIRTPDDVLYLGDALLTGTELDGAKLPYCFSVEDYLTSMEKLPKANAALYLAAHRGFCREIERDVSKNRRVILQKAEEVRRLIAAPMTIDQIGQAACRQYLLCSSHLDKAATYERNIRPYVEYLRDTGAVNVWADNGVIYYQATS